MILLARVKCPSFHYCANGLVCICVYMCVHMRVFVYEGRQALVPKYWNNIIDRPSMVITNNLFHFEEVGVERGGGTGGYGK